MDFEHLWGTSLKYPLCKGGFNHCKVQGCKASGSEALLHHFYSDGDFDVQRQTMFFPTIFCQFVWQLFCSLNRHIFFCSPGFSGLYLLHLQFKPKCIKYIKTFIRFFGYKYIGKFICSLFFNLCCKYLNIFKYLNIYRQIYSFGNS